MLKENANAVDSSDAQVRTDPQAGTLPRSREPRKLAVPDAMNNLRNVGAARHEASKQLMVAQNAVHDAQRNLDRAEDEYRLAEEELMIATGHKELTTTATTEESATEE